MEVIDKLKRWVLKRNDRLFQDGKILRAKLSKLRLDNDYDGVKASELADEAELSFDKAALTEAIMRKRDVGETLSRDCDLEAELRGIASGNLSGCPDVWVKEVDSEVLTIDAPPLVGRTATRKRKTVEAP